MTPEQLAAIKSAALLVFRDRGDADYLLARSAFRMKLFPVFMWSAHQTIEKLLKGILVSNIESSKKLGHDLRKALTRIQSIKRLNFQIPTDVEQFLEWLDDFGHNRYRERMLLMTGDELARLDRAVWFVRKYCQYFGFHDPKNNYSDISQYRNSLGMVEALKPQAAKTAFQINGGFLEQVLRGQVSKEARRILIWRNGFFSARTHTKVVVERRLKIENSVQIILSGNLPLIRKFIQFSREDEEFFDNNPNLLL